MRLGLRSPAPAALLAAALVAPIIQAHAQALTPAPAATPRASTPARQAPATAPAPLLQISPAAAYADAMHPLDVTRRSVANWSESELGALTVAISRAREACLARQPDTFSGEDLLEYARLCGLGQQWAQVALAAGRYLSADGDKPLLTAAWAAKIDAELHLQDEPGAFRDSKLMLAAVPYDATVATAVNEALDYMEFSKTDHALELAALRQPQLLQLLKAKAAAQIGSQPSSQRTATQSATQPAGPPTSPANPEPLTRWSEPPQSVHELFADGLTFATLQELSGASDDTRTLTLAALDAALPGTLSPDDTLAIGTARRRYALLGHPLPQIKATAFLTLPRRVPGLPAQNAVTALLVFPDWCVQCLRMPKDFPTGVFLVERQEAYLYGVLVETVPQNPTPAAARLKAGLEPNAPLPPTPSNAELWLAETPTAVAPAATLDTLGVHDVPFLLLTDTQGIVRVAQPVADDAAQQGGTVDRAIALVGHRWPAPRAPLPEPASTASP